MKNEIKVTVVQQITNITLDKTAVEINAGEKASIAASVLPANAGNKKVVWSSSDEKIAKVDQKGMITAVGRGTAVITCSAADGMGAKTTCRVTVKQRVTSIKLDATTMKLFVGNKQSLTQTVLPENAKYGYCRVELLKCKGCTGNILWSGYCNGSRKGSYYM